MIELCLLFSMHSHWLSHFNSRHYSMGGCFKFSAASALLISIPSTSPGVTLFSPEEMLIPKISFLTTTKGATFYYNKLWQHNIFQFPPLHEGRLSPVGFCAFAYSFQFPPLHGGRPIVVLPVALAPIINSLHFSWGDDFYLFSRGQHLISIPATSRGETN